MDKKVGIRDDAQLIRERRLEQERERENALELAYQYQNQLQQDRTAVMNTLAHQYGFGLSSGYGTMTNKEFKEQLMEAFQAKGMSSIDAEMQAEIVTVVEQKKYEEIRKTLEQEGLYDTDDKTIHNPAPGLGYVVFDSDKPADEQVAQYGGWALDIEGRQENGEDILASDGFDSNIDYFEGDELFNEEPEELIEDEYTNPELAETEEEDDFVPDENADLGELVDSSDVLSARVDDAFHEELARLQNGEMSAFEREAFQNAVADGAFGSARAGLANDLDFLAFGQPSSQQQIEKIAGDLQPGYEAMYRRGVPDALIQMPGGFDPEYKDLSGRPQPDQLKTGIEGYQEGIDYEMV